MCGRFTQRYTWREIHDLYGLTGAARNLQAHYNIAPTDTVDRDPARRGGKARAGTNALGPGSCLVEKMVLSCLAPFAARRARLGPSDHAICMMPITMRACWRK